MSALSTVSLRLEPWCYSTDQDLGKMGAVHSVLVLIPCLSVFSTACIKNYMLSTLLHGRSMSVFCLCLTKRGSSLCLQWWTKVSLSFSPSALTAHLAWRPLVAVGGERHFLSLIFHLSLHSCIDTSSAFWLSKRRKKCNYLELVLSAGFKAGGGELRHRSCILRKNSSGLIQIPVHWS